MNLKRKQFNILMSIIKKQPWLSIKTDAIEELLFQDCQNTREQNLLIDLLERFTYITSQEFKKILSKFVNEIINDPILKEEDTIITSTTMDSDADSGQYVIYELKRLFGQLGWDEPTFINRASDIHKKINGYKNVIYFDEFVGTGRTILNRIKFLKERLEQKSVSVEIIRVYAVGASSVGRNALLSQNIDFRCGQVINRGISDYYINSIGEIALMTRLEDVLSDYFNDIERPYLGYGHVEALFAREDGNTPNNVFPIFWWKYYKNGQIRKTITSRLMGG